MTEASYTRSNGTKIPVKLMGFHHLTSAHAKLVKDYPEGHHEIAGMAEEIARRQAEHAEKDEAK